MMMATMVKHVL